MEELKYFTLSDNVAITNSFDTLKQRVDNVETTLNELAERLIAVVNQLGISTAEAGAIISSAFQNIYSNAEGASSSVSGLCSHAEGAQTRAYGAYAMAEGHRNCDGNALIEHALALLDDAKLEEGWDWLDHDVD